MFVPRPQVLNPAGSANVVVKNPEKSSSADKASGQGFHISDEPVVRSDRVLTSRDNAPSDGLPPFHETDLLYVIARDPKSLFVYWDLNWTRLFAQAGLAARQVHLRIYREDGSIEDTREINPFRGHCYADVAASGMSYQCELGCFDEGEWTALARAGRAATPKDSMSEDISAQFTTLPLHLSFQRMLDIFRASKGEAATLARSVAELQESARAIEDATTADEWSRIAAIGAALNGSGGPSSELAALLRPPRQATPTAEELVQWRQLGEEFGGSSPGGASGSGPA